MLVLRKNFVADLQTFEIVENFVVDLKKVVVDLHMFVVYIINIVLESN